MRRLFVRRSATAAGIYLSVVFGFLATVLAARLLPSKEAFGLYSIIFAATAFCQSLFDLTVEEALVKYGFRYVTREDWGRLRELYRKAFVVKLAGAAVGGAALLVLAPFSGALFGDQRLEVPMMLAAGIPLGQSLEGLAGTALFLRSRYDIRAAFLTWSMILRLTAIVLAAPHGLGWTIGAIVAAQVVSTASIGLAARLAFKRFPAAPRRPLGEEQRDVVKFVAQSSIGTGVLSLRSGLTPILLGIVTSPTQVAYFRVAQAPQSGFLALSAPIRMVLLTEQTRDWEQGRQAAVLTGVRRYTLVAAAVMLVAVPPLVVFMPDLVELVYGARYSGAANAARVFVGVAAVQMLVGWTKSFPIAVGRPSLRTLTHGIEAIVILPLVIVLGKLYGATGAAFAVFAGMCAFAVAWAFIVVRMEPNDGVAAG